MPSWSLDPYSPIYSDDFAYHITHMAAFTPNTSRGKSSSPMPISRRGWFVADRRDDIVGKSGHRGSKEPCRVKVRCILGMGYGDTTLAGKAASLEVARGPHTVRAAFFG